MNPPKHKINKYEDGGLNGFYEKNIKNALYYAFNFGAIILERKKLSTSLKNSYVKFVRRQSNKRFY